MAVAVVIDIPGGNQRFYDEIIPDMFPKDQLPEGWKMHIAGPTQNGWRSCQCGAVTGGLRGLRPRKARPNSAKAGGSDSKHDFLSRLQNDRAVNSRSTDQRGR